MKRLLYKTALLLVIWVAVPHPGHTADQANLADRVNEWISAVNQGDYVRCLMYLAPPEFTGGKIGLTKTVKAGKTVLFLGPSQLRPFLDYRINRVRFDNLGREAKVFIGAIVIFHPKSVELGSNARMEHESLLFPASIVESWIFLNGEWFIRGRGGIQYCGSP